MTRRVSREARATGEVLDHTLRQLRWIRDHLPDIITRLGDARGGADGYAAGGPSTSSGGADVRLTATEAAASRRITDPHDPAAADIRRIIRRVQRIATDADHLRTITAEYTRAPAPPTLQLCDRCATPTRTPRRGLCGRCHTAWLRAGSPPIFPPPPS